MIRKLIAALALILLFGVSRVSSLRGAAKDTSFTHEFYAGAYILPIVYEWEVEDFAFAIFNPNSTQITITATLTAVNNSSFSRFTDEDCVGSCDFPFTLQGYSSCLVHTGFIGLSGMGLMVELEGVWSELFQLYVRTTGSSSSKKFYFYGP